MRARGISVELLIFAVILRKSNFLFPLHAAFQSMLPLCEPAELPSDVLLLEWEAGGVERVKASRSVCLMIGECLWLSMQTILYALI